MKRTTLASLAIALTVVLVPAVAFAAFPTPKNPIGGGTTVITGNSVMNIIESVLNWAITLGMIIAVAYFVWGGYMYATGDAKGGTEKMKNAAIGIAAMLAVGLVVNSIAAWVNRGLTLN